VPGTYFCEDKGIVLQNGENTFDFSGIVLFAGDLPAQDGIVNSFDVMEIVDTIKKNTFVDAADLNYDGVVDSADYSLIMYSLSIHLEDK